MRNANETETPTRPVPAAQNANRVDGRIRYTIRPGAIWIEDGNGERVVLTAGDFSALRQSIRAAELMAEAGADSFPVEGGEQ